MRSFEAKQRFTAQQRSKKRKEEKAEKVEAERKEKSSTVTCRRPTASPLCLTAPP